jgi:hypothetical protein
VDLLRLSVGGVSFGEIREIIQTRATSVNRVPAGGVDAERHNLIISGFLKLRRLLIVVVFISVGYR